VQGRLPPVELFHGVPGQVGLVGRRGGVDPPGGDEPGGGALMGGYHPSRHICAGVGRIIAAIHLARSQGKRRTCATWSNVGRILLQVPTQYP
jgi:hypothetical protein